MTPPKLTANGLRYLRGPVIQARAGGWVIPDHLQLIIVGARLNLIADGEGELATEEEALAYLHVASLQRPLSSEWTQIALYLAQEVLPRWSLYSGDAPIWKTLGADSPISLYPHQLAELRALRRRIRRAVVKCRR